MKTPSKRICLWFAAIVALSIVASPAMAANPTEPGHSGDGIADLVIHSDGTAWLDPDGLVVNGFILNSLGGNFTGTATLPDAFFSTNDQGEASVGFLFANITTSFDLVQLYDPSALPIFDTDLDFTYTVADRTGLFDGTCIGCVPEPSTVTLAALALLGLAAFGRRRRSA